MNDFLVKISPLLTAIIGGTLVHVFQRNKYWAEVKKTRAERAKLDIENVDSTIDLWRKLVIDLKDDVISLTQEVSELRLQNKQFTSQNQQLTSEIEQLRKENTNLKMEMRRLEQLLKQQR